MQENAFYSGKMRISFRRMKNRLEQGGKSFGAEWRVCLCLLVFGEAENARKYGFLRWKNSIWFVKTWIDEVPKCTSVASCLRKFLVNRIAWAGKQVHKERKGQILLSSWLFQSSRESVIFGSSYGKVEITDSREARIYFLTYCQSIPVCLSFDAFALFWKGNPMACFLWAVLSLHYKMRNGW